MEAALKRLNITEDGFDYLDPKGCYWETIEDTIWGGVLGFCCCGEPKRGLKQLRNILESVESGGSEPCDFDDDTLFGLYLLDKMELTQHEFSIYSSRLSEKGKDILKVLQNLGL